MILVVLCISLCFADMFLDVFSGCSVFDLVIFSMVLEFFHVLSIFSYLPPKTGASNSHMLRGMRVYEVL